MQRTALIQKTPLQGMDSVDQELFEQTFSIIIPAYNEEQRIGPVLRDISEFISRNRLPWQVVIVIEGDDNTESLVSQFAAKYPFIQYIRSYGRGGKGNAVRRGARIATGNYVILMDADNSIKFLDVVSALKYLVDSDGIFLSRYVVPNHIPAIRRFVSRGFNLMVRAFLKIDVKDTQTGYKIIDGRLFRASISRVGVTNTFFDIFLIYYLQRSGARIREVPVAYQHSDGSKFNALAEVMGQGVSLVAFLIRHSRFYRYVPRKIVSLYYRKFKWI